MKPKKSEIFKYFYKREGLLGVMLEFLLARNLITYENLINCGIIQRRRHAYYSGLTDDELKKEIEEFAKVFITNGEKFDIDNPKGLNEKLQWLVLHGDNETKARLADKHLVKEWIKNTIGEEYVIQTIAGPWNNAEQIDFDSLPDRFVLKTNHASGTNIIVLNKDKLNIRKTRKRLNKWLKMRYGYIPYEPQYLLIKPCIFAEEYIEQDDGNLLDYKIFCFNGKPRYFQIIGDRRTGGKIALYDCEWNRVEYGDIDYPEYEENIKKPKQLDKLIEIAGKLAEGFKFVRVDMYIIDDMIKFGEMTFTPDGGFERWGYDDADMIMGNELSL